MDNKKKLIIGGSVAGVAIVALIVVSIVLANRPQALIIRAAANTISDAKRLEAYSVANDVANGGSVAISANLDSIANDDVYVQAKFYSDAKNLRGAYELTMYEDDDVVFQPRVIYDQDRYAVTCPELFDGAYGLNLKNIAKNLPGSIFDPDEETDYSLTDEQYDYFMNMRETVKNDKNLQRDIDNMAVKYRTLTINTFVKYAEVTRSSKTITVGDENIPCTIITLEMDEDSFAQALQEIVDYANDDKDLEKLLFRVASNVSYYEDPDDYVDSFYDSLEEFEDEIDNLDDVDVDIQLDFYITRSGRRIARFDAEMEVENEGFEMSLVLGKNVSKSKEMSLTYGQKNHGDSYSIVYTVDENSTKAYKAEIEFKSTWESYSGDKYTDKSKIEIDWDRKGGDFELEYKNDYDKFVIKGTLMQKGDTYTFVLNNIRSDGEALPYIKSLELTIVVDRHDAVPRVPGKFTDVTTMNEREFKHLMEDVEEGIEDIWDEYFDRY